jgi:hypothetical protein
MFDPTGDACIAPTTSLSNLLDIENISMRAASETGALDPVGAMHASPADRTIRALTNHSSTKSVDHITNKE